MRLERWGGLVVGLSEVLVVVDDEVCIGIMVARKKLVLPFMMFTFPYTSLAIVVCSSCGMTSMI